ncbi:MAG: crotonase/enoyl-CoA hydratase family protein [Proteobacteria bacterium]|nr:crotonase/enoyl-CoA hydratase family protein [Pseudomonadota bacterium]
MSNMHEVAFLDKGLRSPYGRKYKQLDYEFDPAGGVLWGLMNPKGTPCFNLGMLNDIHHHDETLRANRGQIEWEGKIRNVDYYVAASRIPKVFGLGGDLALFLLLIKARDREALAHYARLCIDNVYARIRNYDCPTLTTISLVQGDALGGGFETVLSSDVIIAEESAHMGLPEILFNLFPGMGAYSLLARRIGMRAAEDLILSGKVLPARKLHEMGLVDVIAPDGKGEAAVNEWIAKQARRRNGMQGILRARQHVFPVTREELDGIADTWVDCALRLDDRDLRKMGMIVEAQMRRMEQGDVKDITVEARAANE